DLRVIIHGGLEHESRSSGGITADLLGNSYARPVPVEAEAASGAALIERFGTDLFPARIVELHAARVRRVIVGAHRLSGGLPVGAGACEIDFDNLGVAVAPLRVDQAGAFASHQIDAGFGPAVGDGVTNLGRAHRAGDGEKQ